MAVPGATGGGCMRRAWLALMAAGAVSAAFAMPAVAREFPLLHQGLRFRRRCRRLQFFVAGAVSGDRLRARCELRCKPLFQRQGGHADRSQPPIPKEILMRILALAILAIGMVSASAPARAQTYGAGYPVCLHVYGPVSYYECNYTSIPQCNASASG